MTRADLEFLGSFVEPEMIAAAHELRLLRKLEATLSEYLNHSGRSKAWMSIDTLRQTVARIKREIDHG